MMMMMVMMQCHLFSEIIVVLSIVPVQCYAGS
jgi:hypothetical protein